MAEPICPLIGGACLQHGCHWYIKVVGQDPQVPGKVWDEFRCTFAWLPLLLIENSKKQHETAAEISAFRVEIQDGNIKLANALREAAQLVGESVKALPRPERAVE